MVLECMVLLQEFLHNVRSEFTDDVSELTVGPVFTGHMNKNKRIGCFLIFVPLTSEDGTHIRSETSSVNALRISCKKPKTNKQY